MTDDIEKAAGPALIDDMAHSEAKSLLLELCAVFHIGCKARTGFALLENVRNSACRSRCLDRIEALYTTTEVDEDGDEFEVRILSWGHEPEEYEATYRAAVFDRRGALEARVAELEEWQREAVRVLNECVECSHATGRSRHALLASAGKENSDG